MALEIFRWMGGWRPELMPMATFLFDLQDPGAVQERVMLIASLVR